MKIGLVFVVSTIVAWFFVGQIFDFLLKPGGPALGGELSFTSVTAPFMTYIKLAMYTGLMVSLPVLFYQGWSFVAPAVGEVGRLFTYVLATMASLLFVCGVAFGYYLVLPIALGYLIGWDPERFNEVITTDAYLSFITRFLLAFGVAFEVPAATYVGAKLGLINAEVMRKYRRHAIMANAVIAAFITPADPFSMFMLAIPLILLYEGSIFIAERVNPLVKDTLPDVLDDDEDNPANERDTHPNKDL